MSEGHNIDKIAVGDSETRSADVLAENLERMKSLFPEAFTEGKVDFNVLRQLLGDVVDESEEKYGLNWHGKRQARQLALTPSTGTLRPCPEDSVDWDTTQNLMIEGDNLEVLKLLQKSYAGKVKLIYIDPPYNTGKDFIYPDDYRNNIRNYLELTGQVDGKNRKLSSNPEASGRFHTEWLNMMYPRLKVARNLLTPDGALLCHIDENECSGLEKLIEEIFGGENILGTIIWDKCNPKGDATGIAYQHEVLYLVSKDKTEFVKSTPLKREKLNSNTILAKAKRLFARIGKQHLPEELKLFCSRRNLPESQFQEYKELTDLTIVNQEFAGWIKKKTFSGGESLYKNIDENGDVYRLASMAWPNKQKKAPDEYFVPLKHPNTGQDCPVPNRGWRNPPDTMQSLIDTGGIIFGEDHTTQPQRKYLLKAYLHENFPSILRYGGSDDNLLGILDIPFDTAKPVELSRQLIASLISPEDIVVDFFAGSGTVGHAVMLQNLRDSARYRYLLVQLPARLSQDVNEIDKQQNLADITKERLRRAACKIKDENPDYNGDLGFRVFKLDTSNIRAWDPNPDDLEGALLNSIDHIQPGRTEQDILYEALLKLGFDLCVPIETKAIADKTVCSVGAGTLFACLDETVSRDDAEPLATGIANWHDALAPDGESTVIFRDSAFVDDVAKTNLAEILKQRGLGNVRSL